MHENFVLVPTDKASNNVIVVCKKYYLDVVIKELSLNNTYKEVHNNNVNVISRHLDYMAKNGIDIPEQHEQLPSFYWLPKLHKNLQFQVHCSFQQMHYKTAFIITYFLL